MMPLKTKLEIQYESIDADENGSLADSLEDLLNTNYYPIVIIETPTIFYYLYRPSDAKDAGYTTLNNKATKIGCLTLSAFVTQIKQLI